MARHPGERVRGSHMKSVRVSPKVMAVAAVLALLASRAEAAGEVALARVHSNEYNGNGGAPLQHVDYEVLVKNLAFTKQVSIHGKQADGTWADLAAVYVGPADSGREIWRAYEEINPGLHHDIEIAVKYVVNGVTYWDNNGGANYKLGRNDGSMVVGRNVALYATEAVPAVPGPGYYILGNIDLKNLGPAKTVVVRYTTDNWQSSTNLNAAYKVGPNANGTETWTFSIANVATPPNLKFAVSYTVNGTTYWDNNFGPNYVMGTFHCTLPGTCPVYGANGLATDNYPWQLP